MSEDPTPPSVAPPAVCPRCSGPMAAELVRTTFWRDEGPVIVEDIPAHVCGACMEQFYDDEVGDALRRLAEDGFPSEAAHRRIDVPVFSLTGRVRRRVQLPDDTYLD